MTQHRHLRSSRAEAHHAPGPPTPAPRRRRVGKRLFDIAVSSVALTLFSIPLGLVALAIRLTMGRPVLFVQERPGLHGSPFRLHKFRTMTDARGEHGQLLAEEERVTRLGGFLRDTSLDELPELWNVLRGDMSLVGPRPLLMEYLELYSPEQARRHEVRPGITGLAQTEGRNGVSWERRFELDVWYVDHSSFARDLLILFKTFKIVIARHGISQEGLVGVEPFSGSPPPRGLPG